jgi:hypothetical protein
MRNSGERLALSAGCVAVACVIVVAATRNEARYILPIGWNKPHITHVVGLGYPELGLELDVAHTTVQVIGGKSCVVGNVVSFDVDDAYAFDVDEPVSITLTYAPKLTTASPFLVIWDKNGGDGHGSLEIKPEGGETLKQVTVTLDRARLAGLGAQNTDIAVGARRGVVALCDIAINRSGSTKRPSAFGIVRIEIKDAKTGRLVPARVGIYDESGRAPLPSERAVPVNRFGDLMRRHWVNRRTMWPSVNRQAFYISGRYEARVPSGAYEIAITRGPEYRFYHGRFEVKPNESTDINVALERYCDLPSRGWYSGESHIHLGRELVDDSAIWAQIAAEDLHVGNLLEMGNISGTYFKQPAWGTNGRYQKDDVVLVPGQEDPRTGHRGHTIHWNLQKQAHFASEAFYQYHEVFEETRRQGAITGYAHWGELFNGPRGLAVDVPFGLVDFIEVLQGGRLSTDPWYPLLNLGYRVLPAGGADYPYFGPTLPGVERMYVKLDSPFSADAWFRSFRSGHTYVTNGPFLEMTVNGRQMGDELHVRRGTELNVAAVTSMNPDVDRLNRLELVVLGDVAMRQPANGAKRIELKTTLTADHSMWIAVRAFGEHQERGYTTIAHSAPLYVVVDGEPTWKRDSVPELVQRQRALLQELVTKRIDPTEDLESFETTDTLVKQWEAQLPRIRSRVAEADARYQDLVNRAITAQRSRP